MIKLFLFLVSLNAYAAGKIIDADIAASGTANIARNKLASGTAYAWCTNDISGFQTQTSVTSARAVATDANGLPVASATTATELGFVSGVTSGIQAQLNAKQATISIGAFSSTPTANGLTLSGAAINMDPADGTHPGGVSTSAQTFAGTKTFSAVNVSGLTASQAVVTDASKNLASLAYATANTGSTLVERDLNGNGYFVNAISTTANIVSAGGTTTLTGGSARYEKVTGTSTQTIKMPDATTLVIGWLFEINNNSTQTVTVQDNAGGAIATMPSGSYAFVINTNNGTVAGSWDIHWAMPANASYGTAGMTINGTLNVTGTTTLATSLTGLLKTSSGVVSNAVSGTDYQAPISTDAGTAHQFFNSFTAPNTFGKAQPAFTDISGTATVAQTTIANQSLGTCTTAQTVNWANGNNFTLTLTNANTCALTWSGAVSGQSICIDIYQPTPTGSGAISFATTTLKAATYTMTTGALATDTICIKYNGTDYRMVPQQNFL